MSTNEVDIIEEYNSEKAKAKLFKRIERRRKDDAFMHQGARPTTNLNTAQDTKAFQKQLNSMKVVEETNSMVRYSNMPEIEFGPSINELKAKRKLIKAINRADSKTEKLKERISITNDQQ